MSKQLNQVLKLAKKTGDRIVVFDNNDPENSYVVIGLEEYEEMLGLNDKIVNESQAEPVDEPRLTEEKRADRIEDVDKNKMWKNDQGFPKENIYSSSQIIKNRFKPNQNWKIPPAVREAAEKDEPEIK